MRVVPRLAETFPATRFGVGIVELSNRSILLSGRLGTTSVVEWGLFCTYVR